MKQLTPEQIQEAINSQGSGDLNKLIIGHNSWKVK